MTFTMTNKPRKGMVATPGGPASLSSVHARGRPQLRARGAGVVDHALDAGVSVEPGRLSFVTAPPTVSSQRSRSGRRLGVVLKVEASSYNSCVISIIVRRNPSR